MNCTVLHCAVLYSAQYLSVERVPGLDEDPVQREVDASDVAADVADDAHGELQRHVRLHRHHVEHHLPGEAVLYCTVLYCAVLY